jgi:malate synthase
MEDMATGEIRLGILWEWLHKGAVLSDDDEETAVAAGDVLTADLFERLLEQECRKLLAASDRNVHDASKTTTLPIVREIVETYVTSDLKLPWYIDLLNVTLDNHDLTEARRRIRRFVDAFRRDGTRVTDNLDFDAAHGARAADTEHSG